MTAATNGRFAPRLWRPRTEFGRRLLLITAAALVLRVAYVIWYEQTHLQPGGDAFYYHWQARALVKGLGFVDPFRWKCLNELDQSASHPPLYSMYLAAVGFLGGTATLAQRIATAFAGATTVALVGMAGREWRDERTGIVAAVIAAATPTLWVNDGLLMSETVFATTVALLVWLSFRYRRGPSTRGAAWIGVALALAALARAEAIVLAPLLVVPLLLGRGRGGHSEGLAARLRPLAAAGLSCAAVLAPWVGHNLTRFDEPVYLSTGLGSVLAVANCDSAYEGRLIGQWSPLCANAIDDRVAGRPADQEPVLVGAMRVGAQLCVGHDDGRDAALGDESEREQIRRREALEYVSDHSGDLWRVVPARLGRTFEVFRPSQSIVTADFVENRGKWASRVAQWVFYGLALVSIDGVRRARRARLTLLETGSMLVLVILTSALTYGNVRFRIPIDVVVPLLATLPLLAAMDRRAARRSGTAPGVGSDTDRAEATGEGSQPSEP